MNLQRVLHLPLTVVAAGVLLTALALDSRLGAATPAPDTDGGQAPLRVLYPPAGAIVTASPTAVVIVGPDGPEPPAVRLDGSPLDLEKMTFAEAWKAVPESIYGPAGSDDLPLRSPLLKDKSAHVVWVAAPELAPGEHTLTLGEAALATFSSREPGETDAAPADEPVLRVHGRPGTAEEALDCAQCHESEDRATLGVARLPQSCHPCHDDVDLSLSHEHVMEFLDKCQMCHDPHAATRPSLLIDHREVVCAQCHDSGYAR